MTIEIRTATIEDAPAIACVMVDTFLSAHRHHMPEEAWQKRKTGWTYAVSERNWRQTIGKLTTGEAHWPCVYVAVDDQNQVVGLATGQPAALLSESAQSVGEITSIYVRTDLQKQTIGRRLLQTVALQLAKLGMKSLQVAVLTTNLPARQFYERLGAHQVGEQFFVEDGWKLPEVIYSWDDIHEVVSAQGKLELRGVEREPDRTIDACH